MPEITMEIATQIHFYYHGALIVITEDGNDELEYYFDNFHDISWEGELNIKLIEYDLDHSIRFNLFQAPLADDFKVTGDGFVVIREEE